MEQGFIKARDLFRKAARDVPAYKEFLKEHRIHPALIKTEDDFKRVPAMDKKRYLERYPLKKLFPHEKIPPMIYASSGSSGKPTFWFRGDAQETAGATIHEAIFKDIFGISKQDETLVIVCFSMGVWVAGNYTLASCRELSRQGYHISTITPGVEMEDIMGVLRKVAPLFKNVIFAGYPPFLMDAVNEAIRRNIPLPHHVKFITAGDKFTEAWRTSLFKLVRAKDALRTLVSIYGSADAGVLGYETPISIFLRGESLRNAGLRKNLFGDEPVLPALVQYDPESIFFEESNGELFFTTGTAAPLIRYNIHDIGKIYSWEQMKVLLEQFGLTTQATRAEFSRWKMPFLVKKGRNDVAVTFYALNVYPENIKAGLDDHRVAKFTSGQFFAFNRNVNREKKQELCVNVELKQGVRENRSMVNAVQKSIVDNLIALNIEYRKLHSILGDASLPKVKLFSFGTGSFYKSSNARGLVGIQGKKMRIREAQS